MYIWLYGLCSLFNPVSYVFLLLCTFCSVYSGFIVPTGTLRLPRLRYFRSFSSVVRHMPGYNQQGRCPSRTLPKLIVSFCVLFVCKNVLYYCHRESTHLKLTNIFIYRIIKLYCGSYPGEKFTQIERVSEQSSAENILTYERMK